MTPLWRMPRATAVGNRVSAAEDVERVLSEERAHGACADCSSPSADAWARTATLRFADNER